MRLLGTGLRLRAHHFGHSIVNQLYPERAGWIGFEHDVRWFNVAMHDATGFCSDKSARCLFNYIQCDGKRHRSITAYMCFERFAFDQFHRVKALAILLAVIRHPGHVWVTNIRRRTCFAQKTGPRAGILCDLAIDDLERNKRIQNCIARAISDGHRSGTKLMRKTVYSRLYFEMGVSQWSRCQSAASFWSFRLFVISQEGKTNQAPQTLAVWTTLS